MGRHRSLTMAISVAVVCAVGCGSGGTPVASPASPPGLSISNGTTLTVTLLVNGTVVGTFSPGAERDPIPAQDLPALPWRVAARSPSGRPLASVTMHSGDASETQGYGVRVDLSCGRLDIWSGPPMIGPAPGTGSPGDCVP